MPKRLTTEQFIEKAKAIHGDKYDYSLVEYKNAKTKVKIICPIHGVFEQRADKHIENRGCPKCAGNKKKSTEEFIVDAWCVHGDRYNYSLVDYKNNRTKVKIICPIHGVFKQSYISHIINGNTCPICDNDTFLNFIKNSIFIHGDKYDYSLVEYKNAKTKVKIICPIHGMFEQMPDTHIRGGGCPKCNKSSFIPSRFDTYQPQLEPYGVECRQNEKDSNILEVKCMYCGRWYVPGLLSVKSKIQSINGKIGGESNLYCSDECKKACPTYRQIKYPKDFKINTSREVQPALRKLVLERDNYTCQKCGVTDKELHCHHYEGIEVNPIESADMDMCITLCKDCHNEVHRQDKCGMKDYKRGRC